MPLISIIIPVYNVAPYLKKCVDSVINQTYTNLEIILVDDGSTDNSGAICDTYARIDKRIKVIHKPNGGLSDARNAGLAVAKGDYIGFVDSDDWVDLNMYAKLLAFAQDKDLDVAMCCAYVVKNGAIYYGKLKFPPFVTASREEMIDMLFFIREGTGAQISVGSKLFRKRVLDFVSFRVGKTSEDVFFCLDWVDNTNCFGWLCDAFYYYVMRSGSITHEPRFKPAILDVVEGYEANYWRIIQRYPLAKYAVLCRLAWAYTICAQRIADCVDYAEHMQELRFLQRKARARVWDLICCPQIDSKLKLKVALFSLDVKLFIYAKNLYQLAKERRKQTPCTPPPELDVSDEKNSDGLNKKKIAFFRPKVSEIDGALRVSAYLLNELVRYYDCSLISVYTGECCFPLAKDVKLYTLVESKNRFRYLFLRAFSRLSQLCDQLKADVYISPTRFMLFLIYFANLGKDTKFIYHNHYPRSQYLQERNAKKNILTKIAMFVNEWIEHRVDRIVVLTEYEKEYYLSHGFNNKQLTFIYNPIDDALLSHSPPYTAEAKAIIICGRIDYQKGYEYLIEVAERVLGAHPDWEYHIYGGATGEGAEYQKRLQADIARRGLAQKVRFMGNHKNIYDIYPKYSFYVMTSRWEGLPMVLIEAKAKGLPIVSFDIHSGPSDIVRDGVDGYLVPPFDVDAMAEKINFLIEHPGERVRLSANSRGNLDKFSKEKIVAQWRELIDGLLEKR